MGQIKSYSLRIGASLLRKYHYVVAYDHRSINQQINLLIHRAVKEFEAKHGEITEEDLKYLKGDGEIRY